MSDREQHINAIERMYSVNVDVHDEDGSTRVYAYENDKCIRLQVNSMNPPVIDIARAACAVDLMRSLAGNGWKGGAE